MTWDENKLSELPQKNGFRLRGVNMTRLETFLDAAFAFSVTLLVISIGTIPNNFNELMLALKGIPAFAASFVSIAFLWIAHRKWSQRYGLEDMTSIVISLFLVFIMLVYVYPLKMIALAFFSWISMGWLPASFSLHSKKELADLFIVYGLGFAFVMLMYTLLYKRALSLSDLLLLNAKEIILTKADISFSLCLTLTAFASALFAFVLPDNIAIFAGFIYWSLPFSMTAINIKYKNKLKSFNSDLEVSAVSE